MKQRQKKCLSLLLALLMLTSGMVACGEKEPSGEQESDSTDVSLQSNTDESDSEESEITPEEIVVTPDLPESNWEGRTFNVLGEDGGGTYTQYSNFEIYAEEMTADTVNDAVYERNKKIEAQYNVKITQQLFDSDDQASVLTNSHSADDKLFDLFFYRLKLIGGVALGGYLYNLNETEYIDFSKPYWNADVNEKVSAYNKLYFTTSDFSLRDKNRAYIMLYNTELAAASQIPDIVSTVKEGKWTIDLMTEYAEMVANDADGDGSMNIYTDQWGVVMDSTNAFATLFYAQDNVLITKDADDALILPENMERIVSSLDACLKAVGNSDVAFFADSSDWFAHNTCYKAGRALFIPCFPHSLQGIYQDCEFESTIIPYPKYDEAQENYYTMPHNSCLMFGIPSGCKERAFSGFMLEALSYASTETSLHAYYDICCKSRYSYNQDSSDMLDLIFAGIRYEPAMIYGISNLYNIITHVVPEAGENLFSSSYASSKKSAENDIAQLKETFDSLDH